MTRNRIAVLASAALLFAGLGLAAPAPAQDLPDPDGKPADMSRKVKVIIMMGQSNMLEYGKVAGDKEGTLEHAVKKEDLYPFLIDDEGNWTQRADVRHVAVMHARGRMKKRFDGWLTPNRGKIGVEVGVGYHVGDHFDEPVLLLKSAIGNRALGWDLLPPGSERFEHTDKDGTTWVYAGYKDSPDKWKKGEEPKKIGWYAGKQYDDDTANAKKVLAEIDKYYPGATGYEVVGFVWWQGDRDSRSAVLSSRYETNLVQLIKSLRKDFDAPDAKFVCASLGQTKEGATDGGGKILQAMKNVADPKKYPAFDGNVAFVYSHPLSMGSSSGAHYGGNAKTYMNVGLALGEAIVKLFKADE